MIKNIFILVMLLVVFSCEKTTILDPYTLTPKPNPDPNAAPNAENAIKWGKMTLRIMERLPSNTPTYGSRALGYMGLTMYETVVNGSPLHRSMAGQLIELKTLPKPEKGQTINYNLAMNAGQAFMLKKLFYFAEPRHVLIDSLEMAIYYTEKTNISNTIAEQSVTYGQKVAEAIYEWSQTDGGHQGNLSNFDPSYKFPSGNGKWLPPSNGQIVSAYPLHPHWGKKRTFVAQNSLIKVPEIIEYSQAESSAYYKMFRAVYDKNLNLSQEEKEIAAWWGDDPTESWTPPGHSYSIVNQIVNKEKINLFHAAEMYAQVGIAVADAFVNCWKAKYTYHCERPSTYVRKVINPNWVQFWPEPPFPAFYSGHSVQGAAAATVLEGLVGKNYAFTDNSHTGRPTDMIRQVSFKARSFNSLWLMAEESAMSRFYGGIHTKLDNEIGLNEGKKIGGNVSNLNWHRYAVAR
jgi:hypothetical protein